MNSESLDSFKLPAGIKEQTRNRNLREQAQFGPVSNKTEERSCSGNVCEAIWKPSGEHRMINGQKS